MIKTISISEFRANIFSKIDNITKGPLLILSRNKPKAILIDIVLYTSLLDRIEYVDDIFYGRLNKAEYFENLGSYPNLEELFGN